MPLTKSGKKVMSAMQSEYGAKKGKSVFYASINKGKAGSSKWHGKEKGFYTHLTHASMQGQEESVKVIGSGFPDAYLPKTPKTDSFNFSNKPIF